MSWTDVVSVLGLHLQSQALPATLKCPLCGKNRLRIYQDGVSGGQWHYCYACKSRGDMIELLGAAWGMDTRAALLRLSRSGVRFNAGLISDENLAYYIDGHVDYHKRIRAMWEHSQRYMQTTSSGTIRGIQRQYRLRIQGNNPQRWAQGPGKLLGALPTKRVEAVFHPNSLDANGHSQSEWRVFRGRKWDEALIFPLYDVPDRIRALIFLGRSGDPDKDQIFKATQWGGRGGNWEAGLGCLPAIELAGNPNTIIATDDWLLALQCHMRTFNVSLMAMPLVVWYDDGKYRTLRSWNMLNDKKIILWRFVMDHRIIRQAMYMDGHISLAGPDRHEDEDVSHFLRQHRGLDLTATIKRRAKPWREAVAQWMTKARPAQVDQVLMDLEAAGEDADAILKQCGKKQHAFDIPSVRRAIEFNGKTVVEFSDQWFLEQKGGKRELILDLILRITHAITDTRSRELFYRGCILYKGKKLNFIERATEFDDKTLTWLRTVLAAQGWGLIKYKSSWKRQLLDIALLFKEPEFVEDDLSEWVQELREKGELEDPI